jgi:hypothetical protein
VGKQEKTTMADHSKAPILAWEKREQLKEPLNSPNAVLEAEKKRRRKREDGRTIWVMAQ